ncbi:MAG: DUF3540 domain-containing protein [Burkholderiaceae bacterium]|jgi:hypothetical protein|nr:DUF3540 domain-containing protein [Burkholderiaceae bacterium]
MRKVNTLRHPAPVRSETVFSSATVREVTKDACVVEMDAAVYSTMPAASCLLQPQAGDEVLLSALPDGRLFILSILTRSDTPAALCFPFGVSLKADLPIRLESATELSLDAPTSALTTGELTVQAGEIRAMAGSCSLLAKTVKTAGQVLENCFDRFRGHFNSSCRLVSGHDDVQAESSRLASHTVQVQADNIHQTASSLVRIDAEQIHIS